MLYNNVVTELELKHTIIEIMGSDFSLEEPREDCYRIELNIVHDEDKRFAISEAVYDSGFADAIGKLGGDVFPIYRSKDYSKNFIFDPDYGEEVVRLVIYIPRDLQNLDKICKLAQEFRCYYQLQLEGEEEHPEEDFATPAYP